MAEQSNRPNAANLQATAILNSEHEDIRSLAKTLLRSNNADLSFLRIAHLHLVETLRPVYTLDEWQAASVTLRKQQGSCSQRAAVLEAVARAAGVPTRVHAFFVKGNFWYPRFRLTRIFIPDSVLLVWPQFYVGNEWLDFDELHGSTEQLVARAKSGFTNSGESIFDAVVQKPIDFLGKSCAVACATPEHNLSNFLTRDQGLFDTRDEVFERFGSFQHTLRGRAFELVYGGRKSA